MTAPGSPRALTPGVARRVLTTAVLLGFAGDALLGDPPVGFAFGCWVAFVAINTVALASQADRRPSLESRIWLAAAVVFAFGLALRDAGMIQALDVLAALGALVLAAVCIRDPRLGVRATRIRETIQAALRVGVGMAVGALPLAFREVKTDSLGKSAAPRIVAWAKTVALVLVTVVLFGALLRSADPVFASIARLPSLDLSDAFRHVFIAGLFAWPLAGAARAALREHPATDDDFLPVPSVGAIDGKAVLIVLNLLFAAFVATQFVALVGGESFVRRTAGLTLADYARHGFFQILFVAALVVPVLILTRNAVAAGSSSARWHTRLSVPIIALIVGMIVAAVWRFAIYVRFFGWTTERLYPLVFMGWLAVVLVWLALTVLRGWPRPFFIGAAATGLATLAAVNVANIDGRIARANVARANVAFADTDRGATELDVVYLAGMSAAAVPTAVEAILDPRHSTLPANQRCLAATRLLDRWGSTSSERKRRNTSGAWRFWNADVSPALLTVAANEAQLAAIRTATCPPPKTTPQR